MNEQELQSVRAQARLHHAYFLGLQLMVSTRKGPEVMGEWMFRLFRRQHEAKFLSSFHKLGLEGLPDAVACAQYHVLSNSVGGVAVEYAYTSDKQAWVRFRYPRWMYDGPVICGIPEEVSHGFLRGWYAHNGVSLENPRLGFVCVSEDVTGEYGLCGYFLEYDQPLQPEDRLVFAKDEKPPAFDQDAQPQAPSQSWDSDRLEKASRNYALEYVRNGLCELAGLLGDDETLLLGIKSARLIGLQYFSQTAAELGCVDGDVHDATEYLMRMFAGMGDTCERVADDTVLQQTVRAVRGLEGKERALVSQCWTELFRGALQSQRERKLLHVTASGDGLAWNIASAN